MATKKAIRKADFFVALLSDISVNKIGMVQSEIRQALDVLEEFPDDRIYLIPVRLTPCKPTNARLSELHWIDLFPSWDSGVDRVLIATEPDPGAPDEAGPPVPYPKVPTPRPPSAAFPKGHRPARVSDAVQVATGQVTPYASARKIEVRFQGEAPTARVSVPDILVTQALTNIIHNALKYSFASSTQRATVDIRSTLEGDNVRVEISNVGLGLDDSDKDHIFAKFFRGKSAAAAGTEGLGVGLWISRRILELADGSIQLESRPVRARHASELTPYATTVTIRMPLLKE